MWTNRGHTGGRPHNRSFFFSPPSFCDACLNFLAQEGFSQPFPSSTVTSNFAVLCAHDTIIIVLHKVWKMSRLTRDGTAEPISRGQILRRERGQGNAHFLFSADLEQDWQPYTLQLIHTAIYVMTIHVMSVPHVV